MMVILWSALALLVICITFVLCRVEAVQNDQEKKEIGDGRKYNHKGYPSFQAQINKKTFESVNYKFVVNLLSSSRFHVQQLINVLYFCWQ